VILSTTKLRDFLSLAQLHIRDYRICRSALVNPDASSFEMLCKSGNNLSLIFLGLDYHSLNYLLRKFTQLSYSSARETAAARRVRSQAITAISRMGMQLVQGCFPCLKDQILFFNDMVECNVFLDIIPMILNF
jgi:hypothetical protein